MMLTALVILARIVCYCIILNKSVERKKVCYPLHSQGATSRLDHEGGSKDVFFQRIFQ